MHVNKLSPKAELMAYLGTLEGIKGHHFMQLENNVIFLGATAIFDETVYPKCSTQKCHATTRINEPIEHQPLLETPSTPNGEEIEDDDDPPPSHPITPALRETYPKQKGKSPLHTSTKERCELLPAPPWPPHSPQRHREPLALTEQPPPVPVCQSDRL
jgi:hypothetical protein